MNAELAYELIQVAQRIRCYIRVEPDDGEGWHVVVGKDFEGCDRDLTRALLKAWAAFAYVEDSPAEPAPEACSSREVPPPVEAHHPGTPGEIAQRL